MKVRVAKLHVRLLAAMLAVLVLFDIAPVFAAAFSSAYIGTAGEETKAPETEIIDEEAAAQEAELEKDMASHYVSGDLADLMKVSGDVAVAAMTRSEKADASDTSFDDNDSEEKWSVTVYYLDEEDTHHVHETDTFSLKYQVEMHFDRLITEPGAVKIVIPAALFIRRDPVTGEIGPGPYPVYANDIAVPYGTPDDPVESRTLDFNYYVDDDGNYVFFNYGPVLSGTNAAFQILYKNLDIMTLVDGSDWELKGTVIVEGEERELPVLSGEIDSYVDLKPITKDSMPVAGKNYGPGLYTERQVSAYAQYDTNGNYTSFTKEELDFDTYAYVAWTLRTQVDATQAYDLFLKDVMNVEGAEIVGFERRVTDMGDNTYRFAEKTENRHYDTKIAFVVRYPKDAIRDEDGNYKVLTNTAEVTAHPYDNVDPDQVRQDAASWTYHDYTWTYSPGGVGLRKSDAGDFYSWLDVYRLAKESGTDKGDFPFVIKSNASDYNYTHSVENDSTLGDRISGRSYEITTADDLIYAYPTGNAVDGERTLLTGRDYYFSGVVVKLSDSGYDPYEDIYAGSENLNSTKIYAVFAKNADGSDNENASGEIDTERWELVAELPAGTPGFTFGSELLSRMPYRVKAVHETTDYSAECEIDLQVRIRHDSKVFDEYLKKLRTHDRPDGTVEKVTLVNEAAMLWKEIERDAYGNIVKVTSKSPDSQTEKDNALYPAKEDYPGDKSGVWMRDSGVARLYPLTRHADSYKTGSSVNDAVNGCVRVRYNLTTLDGYYVYDDSAIGSLLSLNEDAEEKVFIEPGRHKVAFYDLLPLGVQYDPSQPIYAGRLIDVNGLKENYTSWNREQVTVKITPSDVVNNYNNTGRTLVVFHLEYDEQAAPADYLVGRYANDKLWGEGWGLSFGAYYNWVDEKLASSAHNVAAFLPDDGEDTPLFGETDKVFPDNGTNPNDTYYKNLPKTDNDGNTHIYPDARYSDIPSVIYMEGIVTSQVAQAAKSEISKLVRADSDTFGDFSQFASVPLGEGYSYQVQIRTTQFPVKNIVIYDFLGTARDRNASNEHINDTFFFPPDGNYWKGFFNGLGLDSLYQKVNAFNDVQRAAYAAEGLRWTDVVPTVYLYHDPNAVNHAGQDDTTLSRAEVLIQTDKVHENDEDKVDISHPHNLLTRENGWFTPAQWEEYKNYRNANLRDGEDPLDDTSVHGVAIDLGEFVLDPFDVVSFQIHMISPEYDQSLVDSEHHEATKDHVSPAKYAYNDVKYYGVQLTGADLEEPVALTSAPTVVAQSSPKELQVSKFIAAPEHAPEKALTSSFRFTAIIQEPGNYSYRKATDEEIIELKTKAWALYGKEDLENGMVIDGKIISIPGEESLSTLRGIYIAENKAVPLAHREYKLYRRQGDDYVPVDDIIYSTDENGSFYLRADEKAVFLNLDAKSVITVTEEENPFWIVSKKTEISTHDEDNPIKDITDHPDDPARSAAGTEYQTYTNTYRPVVYFSKSTANVPEAVKALLADWEFTFILKAADENGELRPTSDQLYWIVDEAATDGAIPEKLREGMTDENGKFRIKAGEIIALFPGDMGVRYSIEEDTEAEWNGMRFEEYWFNRTESVSGSVPEAGELREMINNYKLKDLYINKRITHQDAADCDVPFTFRITDENGDPVAGKPVSLVLTDRKTAPQSDTHGVLLGHLDENGQLIAADTTDENGMITAYCAGYLLKIDRLDAGRDYTVHEVLPADEPNGNTDKVAGLDNYTPISDNMTVTMPEYGEYRDVVYTNDWLRRPIEISKMVTFDASEYIGKPEELQALYNRAFRMRIEIKDESGEFVPLINTPFIRSGGRYDSTVGDKAIDTRTDHDGEFYVHDGERITFPDIAKIGAEYRVFEFKDEQFIQVFPAVENQDLLADGDLQDPYTGKVEADGGFATFVNGTKDVLIIGKEYDVSPLDEGGIGQAYVELLRTVDSFFREREAVTLTLEAEYLDGGKTVWELWPAKDVENMMLSDILDHSVSTFTWKAGESLRVLPWQQIIISDLVEGLRETDSRKWTGRYRLSERVADRQKLYRAEASGLMERPGTFITIDAESPSLTYDQEEHPVAILKNIVKGIVPKSVIRKRMAGGSGDIPTGAQLIFEVQQFDGASWRPAKDVPYILGTYDSRSAVLGDASAGLLPEQLSDDRIFKTDTNGRITVVKEDRGDDVNGRFVFPQIEFPETLVRIDPQSPEAGDYRIVEIIDPQDSKSAAWGRLASFETLGTATHPTETFVNANKPAKIEIQKFVLPLDKNGKDTDTVFRFELRQIPGPIAQEGPTDEQIARATIGKNVTYSVYERDEHGNKILIARDRTTGEDGVITLKDTQWAELNVQDSTSWTVRELVNAIDGGVYDLKTLEVTGNGEKKNENLAVLNAKGLNQPDYIVASAKRPAVETEQTLTVDDFISSVVMTDETVKDLLKDFDDELELLSLTLYRDGVRQGNDITPAADGSLTVPSLSADALYKNSYSVKVRLCAKETLDKDGVQLNTEVELPIAIPATITKSNDLGTKEGNYYRLNFKKYELREYGASSPLGWSGADKNISDTNTITCDVNIPPFITAQDGKLYVVKQISESAFSDGWNRPYIKNAALSLTLPDTLEYIRNSAFSGSVFSGNLVFPASLKSIGSSAFGSIPETANITLAFNEGLEYIGSQAFNNSKGIRGDLYLPNSLKQMDGNQTFKSSGIDGILHLSENPEFTTIPVSAFEGVFFTNETLVIPANIKRIESSSLKNGHYKNIVFEGDTIDYIGDYAFKDTGYFMSVTFPKEVTEYVGERLFDQQDARNDRVWNKETITLWESGYNTIPHWFAREGRFVGDLIIPECITKFSVVKENGNLTTGAFVGNRFDGTLTVKCDPNIMPSETFDADQFVTVKLGVDRSAGSEKLTLTNTDTITEEGYTLTPAFSTAVRNSWRKVTTLYLGAGIEAVESGALEGFNNSSLIVYADTSLEGRIAADAFGTGRIVTIIYQDIP